jgi:chorismate-pyruvate lyase
LALAVPPQQTEITACSARLRLPLGVVEETLYRAEPLVVLVVEQEHQTALPTLVEPEPLDRVLLAEATPRFLAETSIVVVAALVLLVFKTLPAQVLHRQLLGHQQLGHLVVHCLLL